jgi:hypothetical protein
VDELQIQAVSREPVLKGQIGQILKVFIRHAFHVPAEVGQGIVRNRLSVGQGAGGLQAGHFQQVQVGIPVDAGNAEAAHARHAFPRLGTLERQVAEADHGIHRLSVDLAQDGLEGRQVAVYIADHRNAHSRSSPPVVRHFVHEHCDYHTERGP